MDSPLAFNIGGARCWAIGLNAPFHLNVLLIRLDGQWVLIDTGFGRDGAPEPSGLADRLRLAGAEPAAISLVILSHADFDHVGGAVNDSGALAFPHARHILPRAAWDFW